MITEQINASVSSSGVINEVSFNLDREGLPVILGILRNQLYSNKELAVIREYSCNAFDSMVQAGKGSQPIKISLPNQLAPSFKIRDYGAALSQEEIEKIFVSYGASTKRNSNSYIGCMGIGAKSGFAYSDSFLVVSYHNGIKRTYSAFIDPSQIGKLALLGEEPTDEETGLEIVIPVRDEDISKFILEATRFFKFWRNRPIFEGAQLTFNDKEAQFESNTGAWKICKPDNYSYTSKYDKPFVIMGNVAYPIRPESLNFSGRDSSLRDLLNVGINIYVNIGELEVSASREDLQYTNQTQDTIFKYLADAKSELILNVNQEAQNCPTMSSAKKLFSKIFDTTSVLYPIKNIFTSAISFKGKIVNSADWQIGGEERCGAIFTHYSSLNGRGRKMYASSCYRFMFSDSLVVIEQDEDNELIRTKISPIVELTNNFFGAKKQVLLYKVTDAAKFQKWKDEEFFDAPVTKLSALPAMKLKDIYGAAISSGYKNSKHSSKVFKFDLTGYHASYSANSEWWQTDEVDLDNDGGVYVVIDRFEVQDKNGSLMAPAHFKGIIELFNSCNIPLPTKITGVKTAQIEKKSPAKMEKFWDYAERVTKDKIKSLGLEQKYIDRSAAKSFESSYTYLLRRVQELKVDANQEFGILNSQYSAMLNDKDGKLIDALINLAKQLKIEINLDNVTQTFDLNSVIAKIYVKYPITKSMMECDSFGYYWNNWKNSFQSYVTLVES